MKERVAIDAPARASRPARRPEKKVLDPVRHVSVMSSMLRSPPESEMSTALLQEGSSPRIHGCNRAPRTDPTEKVGVLRDQVALVSLRHARSPLWIWPSC